MDLDKALTLIEILIPYAPPVIIFLFVYLLARGKNSLFSYHLWKNKLNIDIDIKNPQLAKYVEEKLDLEKLKLHFPKVNFYSLDHAKELLKWAKNNNVSSNELAKFRSGIIFDRKNPGDIKFELPKGTITEQFSSGILCLVFLILFFLMLSIAPFSGFGNSILIKTKTTDVFMLINSNQSITYKNFLFGEKQSTGPQDCKTKITEIGANERESDAMCNLIADKSNTEEYFKISRKETGATLAIMLPFLAFGFMYFAYTNNLANSLIKFEKSINQRKPTKKIQKITDLKIIRIIMLHLGIIKEID